MIMKLLNSLLIALVNFGKKFSTLTANAQLIVAGLLIFCVYQLTSSNGNNDLDKLKFDVQKTTEISQVATDSIKKLTDQVKKTEVKIEKLSFELSRQKGKRSVLQTVQSRLDTMIVIERDTSRLVALQDTAIDNLKGQLSLADQINMKQDSIIIQQDTSIKLLKNGLVLSERRADTLQTTLNTTLKKLNKKDKFFGFIPMPNRKFVAATAVIGGIYLGTQIKR